MKRGRHRQTIARGQGGSRQSSLQQPQFVRFFASPFGSPHERAQERVRSFVRWRPGWWISIRRLDAQVSQGVKPLSDQVLSTWRRGVVTITLLSGAGVWLLWFGIRFVREGELELTVALAQE